MLDSQLEIKTHKLLEFLDIPFEEEYQFSDLKSTSGRALRFDFACFTDDDNLICLIECQGKQHYSPVPKYGGKNGFKRQRFNDNLKRQYCRRKGIRLMTIPYFDENKLDADYIAHLVYGY